MTPPQNQAGGHARNFYGRRIGKSLRPSQRRLLEDCLEHRLIPGVEPKSNPQRLPADLSGCFSLGAPIWLEVGFGSGENLARLASMHPEVGFIGCEPYINGVASLLSKLEAKGLSNVRIHPGDVRELFDVAPEDSVDRVFLLYPDPWPKRRHHRRRFVSPEYLEPLARMMRPDAELRIATDVPDYARQAVVELRRNGNFRWCAARRADWMDRWEGWESTRYEKKAKREGRTSIYLNFARH